MKVAILAATGKTGQSIVNGLLESTTTKFEITALTRPSSLDKPATQALTARGVKVVPLDLEAIAASRRAAITTTKDSRDDKDHPRPQNVDPELVKILTGIDVVISATYFLNLDDQIPLIDAAKAAGVSRFVPCNFQTVAPRGVQLLADFKYAIQDYITLLRQPYTVIEVGWWYQISLPRVGSGKLDGENNSLVYSPARELVSSEDAQGRKVYLPSALTDLRDVGRFVARIVADERTLNKSVFAYGEVVTHKEVWDLVGRVSGEKVIGDEITPSTLRERRAAIPLEDRSKLGVSVLLNEYARSWGVRGDNIPEVAAYLGFLDARELYPDFKPVGVEEFVREALEAGKASA